MTLRPKAAYRPSQVHDDGCRSAPWGPYLPHPARLGLLVLATAACGPRFTAERGPVDPALEAEAVDATRPSEPLQINFGWRGREAESVFSGRGVARIEPPYRARLDLFGPRDEPVLNAALVDDELRLPPVTEPTVTLPTPALLWSILGVVRPPPTAELVRATRDRSIVQLDYARDRELWRYQLEDGRLRRTEYGRDGNRIQSVELRDSEQSGAPGQGVYRDWVDQVELILEVDTVEPTAPFPAEIWRPGAP